MQCLCSDVCHMTSSTGLLNLSNVTLSSWEESGLRLLGRMCEQLLWSKVCQMTSSSRLFCFSCEMLTSQ